MKLNTYQGMLLEYQIAELDPDDDQARKEMLSKYSYSAIVEGDFLEFDNLNKWIEGNFNKECIISLFYGKTGYDDGFKEYFFNSQQQILDFIKIVPNIYTLYPTAYPTPYICKTDGYNNDVAYNPEDKNAVLMHFSC